MKRSHALFVFATALVVFSFISCKNIKPSDEEFTFVFMTDIHLTPDRNAVTGLKQALKKVNELNPDFVVTGGDLIMDALAQSHSTADSLYDLYIETMQELKIPLYNTMGNHEIFGIYSKSGADSLHPEFGEKMFESRIGKSYYSFMHKGWKFMIMNSVEDSRRDGYIGKIDEEQIKWIKEELVITDTLTPIVISTHIPFITANTQKYRGTTVANDSSTVIYNGKEVLDLFQRHNLKLVLQGHLHTVEDIFIDGVHFVTGGAVSAAKWTGSYGGIEEGFMLIEAGNNNVSCRYIDYGWEVENK
jgi:3',5'-cyclic AMP phosphodiesterase CpdA